MNELLGVPLHAAVSHFPVAAAAFAAAALLAAAFRPPGERGAWRAGAALLLGAALVSGGVSILSGRAWADSLGLLPGAGWIPPAAARGGVLRLHALLALGSLACAAVALAALAARPGPAGLDSRRRRAGPSEVVGLAGAILAAVLALAAGHAGGRMAHGDAGDGRDKGSAPVSASGRP